MMRRIEAEERLAAIRDRAAAAGTLPKGEGQAHARELARQARSEGARAARPSPAALANMGIGIRTVAKQASGVADKGLSDG